MSKTDPYLMMRSDVRQSLLDLSTRLRAMDAASGTPEAAAVAQQIRGISKRTTEDLEALEKGVAMTLKNPTKYGLTQEEVLNRQAFVKEAQEQLLRLVTQFEQNNKKGRTGGGSPRASAKQGAEDRRDTEEKEANNEFVRNQMEAQAQLRAHQEVGLDDLMQGTRRIRVLAENITVALKEDDAAMGELDQEMDSLSGRLKTANKRLDELMNNTSDKKKFICIGVLFLILAVMVIMMMM